MSSNAIVSLHNETPLEVNHGGSKTWRKAVFGTPAGGDREAFVLGTMAGIVANIAKVLVVHRARGVARVVVAKQAIAVASRSAAARDRTLSRDGDRPPAGSGHSRRHRAWYAEGVPRVC